MRRRHTLLAAVCLAWGCSAGSGGAGGGADVPDAGPDQDAAHETVADLPGPDGDDALTERRGGEVHDLVADKAPPEATEATTDADAQGDAAIPDEVGTDIIPPEQGYLTPEEQAAEEAMAKLRGVSAIPVRVHMRNLVPEALVFDVPAAYEEDPVERALLFLEEYRDLFKLEDPRSQLAPTLTASGQEGSGTLFKVLVNGRELFGSTLGVHFVQDSVRSVFASYVIQPALEVPPSFSATEAVAAALAAAGEGTTVLGEPKLVYYAPQVLALAAQPTRLAWRVVAQRECGRTRVALLDAADGTELLGLEPRLDDGPPKDFVITNAKNNCSDMCWMDPGMDTEAWYNENGKVWVWVWTKGTFGWKLEHKQVETDADGEAAFNNLNTFYDFLWNSFGQLGWNDRYDPPLPPARIKVFVHVLFKDENGNCSKNGGFNACGIALSDGYPVLDVLAHEFTHGLVRVYLLDVSDLYESHTGAINESLADMFGYLVDSDDTHHGEDIPDKECCAVPDCPAPAGCPEGMPTTPGSRDVANPALCGDPDHMDAALSSNGQGFCSGGTNWDHGWIHSNSGILNSSAYRMINGGTHPNSGIEVKPGLGLVKGGKLLYKLLTASWSPPMSFVAFAHLMVSLAEELKSESVFNSDDVRAVRNAYAGAGLLLPDLNNDGFEDQPGEDPDGDGLSGELDNCPLKGNTDQADQDDDGVGDACDPDRDGDSIPNFADNCPAKANWDQKDTVAGGPGDACDDQDGDGLLISVDNCPTVANPDQTNFDGDGMGDVCDDDDDNDGTADADDHCPFIAGYSGSDNDLDFWGAYCDNCPSAANPDQADLDGDGKGDACDPDQDGDGLANQSDNCPLDPNPDQTDCDEDGLGKPCDEEDFPDGPLVVPDMDGYEFVSFLSGKLPSTRKQVTLPLTLCTGQAECLSLAGSYLGLHVELAFSASVRVVDDAGHVMVEAPFRYEHMLEFKCPYGLQKNVPAAPFASVEKKLYVQLMAPESLTAAELACQVRITGPYLTVPNQPPFVTAGPDQVAAEGSKVLAAAVASDPNGDPPGLVWELVSGPALTLEDAGPGMVTFVAPFAPAQVTLKVTATDADGATASDELVVSSVPAGPCTPVAGKLSLKGVKTEGYGSALWNADGSGPEPKKDGHMMQWTQGSPCFAGASFYYMASRDYVDPQALGGGHGAGIADGFPLTKLALLKHGWSAADLKFRFGLASLGKDIEGVDWSYNPATTSETRKYSGGTLTFLVGNEPIASAPWPVLTALLKFGNINDCFDDAVSGSTDYVLPTFAAGASSPAAQEVAWAFIGDIGVFGVRLVFDSLVPLGQSGLTGNGRIGAVFDMQNGALEVGTVPLVPCE